MPAGKTDALAALILAAGCSSRMGRGKALLPIAGQPLIAHVVAGFRRAGIGRIGVVTGHHAETIEPLLRTLGVEAIANPDYRRGMYSSVQAGIAALPGEVAACFVLPVDIPLVRPATIAALAARFARDAAPVTYPRFAGRRGHPPLIARALYTEILAGAGDGGLRALLGKHWASAADVDVPDEGIVLDMDTPEDYQRLARLARRRHLPSVAECAALLATRPAADALYRHGRAVAAVAGAIADALATGPLGAPTVDADLLLAASLLHDVAKGEARHAEAGAALVERLGYPALARVIGRHMEFDFDGRTLDETAIVFLADKLVSGDHRVSLAERFRPALERFGDQPAALLGATRRYATARAILALVERTAAAPIAQWLADSGVPGAEAPVVHAGSARGV